MFKPLRGSKMKKALLAVAVASTFMTGLYMLKTANQTMKLVLMLVLRATIAIVAFLRLVWIQHCKAVRTTQIIQQAFTLVPGFLPLNGQKMQAAVAMLSGICTQVSAAKSLKT